MDKGGKLLHRISAELDQFDLSFEHVPRNDPRIKVVDDLGRDPNPQKAQIPRKVRYLVDHESNGYYFRTTINEEDIDCMIDSGATLSMMRLCASA
jgi:predicted aspartyl protease